MPKFRSDISVRLGVIAEIQVPAKMKPLVVISLDPSKPEWIGLLATDENFVTYALVTKIENFSFEAVVISSFFRRSRQY